PCHTLKETGNEARNQRASFDVYRPAFRASFSPGPGRGRFRFPAPSTPHARRRLMAKNRGDFTDILVRRQILSPDQLGEARAMAQQTGAKIQDTLLKLSYATPDEVMAAIAEFHGMQFVDLKDVTVPPSVI